MIVKGLAETLETKGRGVLLPAPERDLVEADWRGCLGHEG
ncbi:hypothetical protein FHT02_003884 [Sphingomonas xinjiangensis]|uniref:Uncharacterized protein n=1 Tax=Sphingomonas xinjiangensis TaxID=643568 RepID=A0A840YSH5_9SPHN|nr:hypothetical protein [Sphingomonas xinjiangensis]